MTAQKTYFVLPNFDYPPGRLIQLGQIITSPSKPWERLSEALPVPKETVQTSLKTDWGTEIYRAKEQRVGIWAQFAALMLGIGGDAIVAWSQKNAETFQFDELETSFFEPEKGYVEASVVGADRNHVAEWVKQNPRKSVYMVTGLKVARGAKHLQARSRGVDFDVKPAVDAMPFTGIPIGGGPSFGLEREKGEASWFSGSSDFVFAYRLRRIIIKRKTVMAKEYITGATVAHDDDSKVTNGNVANFANLRGTSSNEAVEIVSIEQSGQDYGSAGYDYIDFAPTKVRDEQDGEECLLQVPASMLPGVS